MIMIQLTGLSGSGKTSIARLVKEWLEKDELPAAIIDGDVYRKTICKDLGFSKEDRHENMRRLAEVARGFVKDGKIAIIAAINPYEQIRDELKRKYNAKTVWVNCEMEELIRRDTKGLYKKALLPDDHPEKIFNFTGISDPFEAAHEADLILHTHSQSVEQSAHELYDHILEWLTE